MLPGSRCSYIQVQESVIPIIGLVFDIDSSDQVVKGDVGGRFRSSATSRELIECLESGDYIAFALIARQLSPKVLKGDFRVTGFRASEAVDDICNYRCRIESVGELDYDFWENKVSRGG